MTVSAGQPLYLQVGSRDASSGTYSLQASLDVESIVGVVRDTTGTPVPGADVTAQSATSSARFTATAGGDGA